MWVCGILGTVKNILLTFPDWNTLIVGKLSPWIETDSEVETERKNSELVSLPS